MRFISVCSEKHFLSLFNPGVHGTAKEAYPWRGGCGLTQEFLVPGVFPKAELTESSPF